LRPACQFQQENQKSFDVTEPGGSVRVYYPQDTTPTFEMELHGYVGMAMKAVTNYIGHFPVPLAEVTNQDIPRQWNQAWTDVQQKSISQQYGSVI